MRLIDADALLESIENPYQHNEVAMWVNDAPTIVRNKKGKWILNNRNGTFKIWDCSSCGIHMEMPCNFCPNCGADMRDKNNE